jgi:hypothetical protein
MARLSKSEKAELLRIAKSGSALREPKRAQLSARSYIEFATFASRFARGHKPVHFEGKAWKL